MEQRKLIYFVLRLAKLPLWILKSYVKGLVRLMGVKKGDFKPPNGLFLSEKSYPWLSKLTKPISWTLSIIYLVLKAARIVFSPDILLRNIVCLILFQSFYELSGFWWRRLRWKVWSNVSKTGKLATKLHHVMDNAKTYQEWREAKTRLSTVLYHEDRFISFSERQTLDSIQQKIDDYSNLLNKANEKSFQVNNLRHYLRSDLLRKRLDFSSSNPLLKKKVAEYQHLQLQALDRLASKCLTKGDLVQELEDVRERLAFFKETKLSYGNSAILFSGGATLGFLHSGVLKTLAEEKLLPRVLGGSSAGSIIVALAGTATDEELHTRWQPEKLNLRMLGREDSLSTGLDKLLKNPPVFQKSPKQKLKRMDSANRTVSVLLPPPLQEFMSFFRRLLPKYLDSKVLLDVEVLKKSLRDTIGDMTFLEAYNRTGRAINISVTPQYLGEATKTDFPQLLNYLTAPDVVIWSASVASCAIPGVFAPCRLYKKVKKEGSVKIVPFTMAEVKWADGSLECDLPISRIKEMFDVNHFIVSQVNPHARLIAPHVQMDFTGFMPSALSNVSNTIWNHMGSLVMFLRDQVRSWLKHFVDFTMKSFIFQSFGKGILPLFIQKYHGDITLTPDIGWEDLKAILRNPTADKFRESRLRGQRMTWPAIAEIRRRCAIEFMLHDCVKALERREKEIEGVLFAAYRKKKRSHYQQKSLPVGSSARLSDLSEKMRLRVASSVVLDELSAEDMDESQKMETIDEEGEDETESSDAEPPMF